MEECMIGDYNMKNADNFCSSWGSNQRPPACKANTLISSQWKPFCTAWLYKCAVYLTTTNVTALCAEIFWFMPRFLPNSKYIDKAFSSFVLVNQSSTKTIMKSQFYVFEFKPVVARTHHGQSLYGICEQERHRSACPSAQSDQQLCYSLLWLCISIVTIIYSYYIWNFKTFACFCR